MRRRREQRRPRRHMDLFVLTRRVVFQEGLSMFLDPGYLASFHIHRGRIKNSTTTTYPARKTPNPSNTFHPPNIHQRPSTPLPEHCPLHVCRLGFPSRHLHLAITRDNTLAYIQRVAVLGSLGIPQTHGDAVLGCCGADASHFLGVEGERALGVFRAEGLVDWSRPGIH